MGTTTISFNRIQLTPPSSSPEKAGIWYFAPGG